MITESDIRKIKDSLSDTFATKSELHSEVGSLRLELKNDLVNFKDAILHEILALRDELSIVLGYREQIENHEHRLEKLEKKIS